MAPAQWMAVSTELLYGCQTMFFRKPTWPLPAQRIAVSKGLRYGRQAARSMAARRAPTFMWPLHSKEAALLAGTIQCNVSRFARHHR